jgi:hypothetical protein
MIVGSDQLVFRPEQTRADRVMVGGRFVHGQDLKVGQHRGAGRVMNVPEPFRKLARDGPRQTRARRGVLLQKSIRLSRSPLHFALQINEKTGVKQKADLFTGWWDAEDQFDQVSAQRDRRRRISAGLGLRRITRGLSESIFNYCADFLYFDFLDLRVEKCLPEVRAAEFHEGGSGVDSGSKRTGFS